MMEKTNENNLILDIKNLKVDFHTRQGVMHAVRGVNFSLEKGEILGIVGESGCGKSVTANTIMGLIGTKKHEHVGGEIFFHGQDILTLPDRERQKMRGNRISMIFQDPMTSLNPVIKVGKQVGEVLRIHQKMPARQALEKAVHQLQEAGIPSARERADSYPFQFSGGMRQRAIIASSLMCEPEILIADEPTTALDVTIQAQILDLLLELRDRRQVSILLITHDLGVVAEVCDTVAVMYAGEIVEKAPVRELFANPAHPYTRGLLHCIPVLGRRDRLVPIPGQPPRLFEEEPGCKFADRCPYRNEECLKEVSLKEISPGHTISCTVAMKDA